MAKNKAKPEVNEGEARPTRHGKSVEERRIRQAEALRANLKKRKNQLRDRQSPDESQD